MQVTLIEHFEYDPESVEAGYELLDRLLVNKLLKQLPKREEEGEGPG